jgi:hypothetical protein
MFVLRVYTKESRMLKTFKVKLFRYTPMAVLGGEEVFLLHILDPALDRGEW